MKRSILFTAVAAAVACTESALTQPALTRAGGSALVTENDRQSASLPPQTACNGEIVQLEGTLHTQFSFTETKSGNVSVHLSADYTVSGVGSLTGAKYQGSLRIRDQEVATSNVADVRQRSTFRLIGQGNVPNSVMESTIHILVSNGQTRVEVVDVSTHCES